MSRKRLFHCSECGGDVFDVTGPGRAAEYRRGIELPVPADFAVPTCVECGETYFTVERSERLAKLQRPAFEQWLRSHAATLIGLLLERHRISLRHLETACGVTSTYFSHVMHGRKMPSLQLVRSLEAFVAAPRELKRILEGRPWSAPADAASSILSAPVLGPAIPIQGGRLAGVTATPATYEAPDLTLHRASNDNQYAA